MKEFIEKLISGLEEIKSEVTSPADNIWNNAVKMCIDKANQLAEEYKPQLNDNDLMIVESLPSLYPMKEFEEEALQRVIGCAEKEYNTGWIPCSEKLPETNESVLCWAKSTARGGDVCFVGSCNNGFWFLQSSANTHSFPGQYTIVAWMPLPEPYQKGE